MSGLTPSKLSSRAKKLLEELDAELAPREAREEPAVESRKVAAK